MRSGRGVGRGGVRGGRVGRGRGLVGVDVGCGNRRYFTMYIKVLYNIKNNKKSGGGGGGGAIFEPKTLK